MENGHKKSWMIFLWLGWFVAVSMTGLSLGGYWLDRQFASSPWGVLGGSVLAFFLIALEIKRLWKHIS